MNNIEAERARLQLTKEEIAMKLGISSKTYRNYTNGKPIPSTDTVNNVVTDVETETKRSEFMFLGIEDNPEEYKAIDRNTPLPESEELIESEV